VWYLLLTLLHRFSTYMGLVLAYNRTQVGSIGSSRDFRHRNCCCICCQQHCTIIGRKMYSRLADFFDYLPFEMLSHDCYSYFLHKYVLIRWVEGIGGGGLVGLTYVIVTDMVSLRERGKWMAIIVLQWAVGSVSGPVIGTFNYGSKLPLSTSQICLESIRLRKRCLNSKLHLSRQY
jgi:hypothetical protein